MAKITKLIINSLKGITVEQELTGKDIIIGPNGSGKTARLKGLVVGIQGYDPALGKRPMDTIRLSSSEKISASIKTDNGFQATRIFQQRGNGKIDHNLIIDPNLGEKGIGQCEARIKEELGDFPVMWDLNEFLNLSPDKKKDFIFNLTSIDMVGYDKEKFSSYFKKSLGMIEGEAFDEPIALWIEKTINLWKDGQQVQEALSNMIAYLKDQLSHWTKKEKEGQAAQKRVTELKAEYEEETAEPIADTKKAIETIQEELTKIREQLARDNERMTQARNRDSNIEILVNKIKELNSISTIDPNITIPDIDKSIQEKKVALDETNEALNLELQRYANVSSELNTLIDFIARLVNHDVNKKCPVSPKINCEQDFSAMLSESQKKSETSSENLKTIKKNGENLREKLEGIQKEIDRLDKLKTDVQANVSKVKTIEMYENQLQELQKQEINTEGIADPETLKLKQQGLKDSLKQKKSDLASKEKIKHALSVASELASDKQKAEDNVEAIKMLVKLLGPKGIQGDIVKDITSPLTDIVRDLVKSINPDYDFMFDLGTEEKPNFDLVCQIKGSWVLFDSLSSGESVVFSAALATALIIQRNPACKILGIEAGDCDKIKAKLLLEGLDKISDHLDNIIVCSHNKFEAPEGWTKWEL